MTSLRLALRLLRLSLVLVLGGLLGGLISLLERLHGAEQPALRQRLTRWFMARLSNALPYRLRITGQLPEQPMLWVANHVSWADIPLLGQLTPLSFLSKAEVRRWPLAGWLAHKAGTLFIRRGAGDSQWLNQQLQRYLKDGRPLLLFPEGTTHDGSTLRTFHGRLLSSAIELQIPLQPVAIRYLHRGQPCSLSPFVGDDDMFSHLLRLLRGEVRDVEIHLLPPLCSHGLNRNQLARQAQQVIGSALYGERDEQTAAAA